MYMEPMWGISVQVWSRRLLAFRIHYMTVCKPTIGWLRFAIGP